MTYDSAAVTYDSAAVTYDSAAVTYDSAVVTYDSAVVTDEAEDEAAIDERETVAQEERQTDVETSHQRVRDAVLHHLAREHGEELADVIEEVLAEATRARQLHPAGALQVLGHRFNLGTKNNNKHVDASCIQTKRGLRLLYNVLYATYCTVT